MTTPTPQQPIKQRCVFYLSGFDPRGGRYYHSLYQEEAQLRPANATSKVDVGRRKLINGNLCWEVTATNTAYTDSDQPNPDHTTHTEFNFLAWDDIVRRHWPKNGLTHWLAFLKQTPTYLLSGFFRKPWVLGPPTKDPLLPAAGLLFFPNILIAGTLLAMAFSSWLIFCLMTQAQQPTWLAALASLPLAWGLWRCAHWFEASHDIGWTMRVYAFTAKQSKGELPELEARLNEFAQQVVARAKQNKDDEILIVGHSKGAVLAVAVMARALALYPELPRLKAKLGLLTMGQCLPMLGLLPGADTFRAELHTLARAKGLFWTDVSAPADRCCVAMIDPYVSCRVEPALDGEGSQFLAVNPLFHEAFTEPAYDVLKKDAVQLHFQYIKAPPAVGAYDYFEVSAGGVSLEERFSQQILLPLPEDFEARTYLRLNPDLSLSESDAIYHYRKHGAREKRVYQLVLPDDFDAVKYLELNPDIAAAGVEAEIHYVQHGQFENRIYKH